MQLTYEQFLDKYKDKWEYLSKSHNSRSADYLVRDTNKPILSVTWDLGGAEGGGWRDDDQARPYVNTQKVNTNIDDLDEILLELCPQMSFLQYKKLEKLSKEYDHTTHEYYGNYTDHRTKYIEAFDLYGALVEMKLITEFEEV